MKVQLYCLNLIVFLSTLSLARSSSCPCNVGLNNTIKIGENWVLSLNRAIKSFKSNTNYYFFLQYVDTFKTDVLEKVVAEPYGIEGSIIGTQAFKNFCQSLILNIETLQDAIANGDDPLEAFTEYFNSIIRTIQSSNFSPDPSASEAAQILDEALMDYASTELELDQQAVNELQGSIGDALLNYSKNYRALQVRLLNKVRSACFCFVPNCEN